ncbi:MAG: carboxypeptidase M32, partial [Halocynthiibacter sp.]
MSSFSELMAFQRRTEALNQTSQRLAWDQETVMPRGATAQRAEEIEAMEAVLHARRTD